jgi:hypothetical protein
LLGSVNLTNYGIPGAEIREIKNIELNVLKLDDTPDLVTLFTGVNDIIVGATVENFENDLNSIFNPRLY